MNYYYHNCIYHVFDYDSVVLEAGWHVVAESGEEGREREREKGRERGKDGGRGCRWNKRWRLWVWGPQTRTTDQRGGVIGEETTRLRWYNCEGVSGGCRARVSVCVCVCGVSLSVVVRSYTSGTFVTLE